jgi:hypothetical protein
MMKMYKVFALIALAALGLAILVGCGGGGGQNNPEQVARGWVEAAAAGDCNKAKTYLSPDQQDYAAKRCSRNGMNSLRSAKINDAVVRESGDYATVTLIGEFQITTMQDKWYVDLEKSDGKWYVYNDGLEYR